MFSKDKMSKTQFETVTRFDEPYCFEICHERKEYARRNRNYARLFSTGDHFFMPFPVGSVIESIFLYDDITCPNNASDYRIYHRKLTALMGNLSEYTEV